MNIFIIFYICCAIFAVAFLLGAKKLLDQDKKRKKNSPYDFYA